MPREREIFVSETLRQLSSMSVRANSKILTCLSVTQSQDRILLTSLSHGRLRHLTEYLLWHFSSCAMVHFRGCWIRRVLSFFFYSLSSSWTRLKFTFFSSYYAMIASPVSFWYISTIRVILHQFAVLQLQVELLIDWLIDSYADIALTSHASDGIYYCFDLSSLPLLLPTKSHDMRMAWHITSHSFTQRTSVPKTQLSTLQALYSTSTHFNSLYLASTSLFSLSVPCLPIWL